MKGMGSLMGTGFQFCQENVLELGYILNNENILDTQNGTLPTANGAFYWFLPQTSCSQLIPDRHRTAQWMESHSHPRPPLSRSRPFGEAALPTQEHAAQSVHGR